MIKLVFVVVLGLEMLGLLLVAAGAAVGVTALVGLWAGLLAAGVVVLAGAWWADSMTKPKDGDRGAAVRTSPS